MPHASLVSVVLVKLFCWGVPVCSSIVHLESDWSADWGPILSDRIPLRAHSLLGWAFIISVFVLPGLYEFSGIWVVVGVRPVNLGCSLMNFSGGITHCGPGFAPLTWAVHVILRNFQVSNSCCG